MIDDLIDLERTAISRAESFLKDLTFLKDLSALGREPFAYRTAFKDSLLQVIDDLDNLAAAAERLPDQLSPAEAQPALGSLGRVLETWSEINATIDRAVSLAVVGKVDKGFQLLSPIANNANLRGRRRLIQIRDRILERASRYVPPPPKPESAEESLPLQVLEIPGKPEAVLVPPAPDHVAPRAEAPAPAAETRAALDYPFLFVETGEGEDDRGSFEDCLKRLAVADELERNDAIAEVLTRFQPELVSGLIRGAATRDSELERVLSLLWRNAEMVILEDYFFSARRTKLTSFLAMAEPYGAATLFRRLLKLFRPGPKGYAPVAEALAPIEAEVPDEITIFLRALLVHPLEEYRRHAVSRLDTSEYWSVVSFPQAPPAALADILEQLALPPVPEDYRKVFFDCTFKTLEEARGVLEVKAARRILTTLFNFDFFMEDDYFLKILRLNEAVEQEEARLGISDAFFQRSIEILKSQKDEVGPKASRPPSFTGIPLTMQRKLARDGHYLTLFVRHPNPKIALETVKHISSPGRAEQVAKLPTVNSLVLLEIAKKEDLFRNAGARMTLLSNPHTPVLAAARYLPLMTSDELRRLAASRDINPDVASYVRAHLARKGVGAAG